MKTNIGKSIMVSAFAFLLCCTLSHAQDQQDPPDFIQIAEDMADRWQVLLKLSDAQTFFVDSTLKHDYVAMNEEMMKLQAQNVTSSSVYYVVQDKWQDAIDASFRRIFNDEQWELYLKNGALKMQKQREKRREKAAKNDMDLKNR